MVTDNEQEKDKNIINNAYASYSYSPGAVNAFLSGAAEPISIYCSRLDCRHCIFIDSFYRKKCRKEIQESSEQRALHIGWSLNHCGWARRRIQTQHQRLRERDRQHSRSWLSSSNHHQLDPAAGHQREGVWYRYLQISRANVRCSVLTLTFALEMDAFNITEIIKIRIAFDVIFFDISGSRNLKDLLPLLASYEHALKHCTKLSAVVMFNRATKNYPFWNQFQITRLNVYVAWFIKYISKRQKRKHQI